jgi:hypothetical protein
MTDDGRRADDHLRAAARPGDEYVRATAGDPYGPTAMRGGTGVFDVIARAVAALVRRFRRS